MRGVKKSRTGCLTCKEKKRKCDEKKPACSRCVNSNLVCPGYAQKIRWRTVHTPKTPSSIDSLKSERNDARYKFMRTHSSPLQSDAGLDEAWRAEPFLEDSVLQPDGASTLDDFPFFNLYPRDADLGPLWDHAYHEFIPFELSDSLPMVNDPVELPLSPVSAENSSTPEYTRHCSEETTLKELEFISEASIELPVPEYTRKALIDFYLDEVAGTLSCFDGPLNPFRSSILGLSDTSQPLACTAQSMAAACLAQTSHQHRSLAKQLQQEAELGVWDIIERGEPNSTTVLILIMLGCSAEWHDPNDHGERYWAQALELLQALSACMEISAEDHHFFRNALAYWRLSNSLCTKDEFLDEIPNAGQHAHSMVTWNTPHPWTGVSEAPIRLLGRVSNLVKSSGSHGIPVSTGKALQEHLQEAAQLECELLRLRLPDQDLILHPRDERTPTSHLVQVGEVYRICGLVRLYRGFPHLLCRSDHSVKASSPSSISTVLLRIPGRGPSFDVDKSLRDLVKCALGILESIPLESGVRFAQPFLLTTLANELRVFDHRGSVFGLSSTDMEVLRARRLVTSRLSALDAHVPPYRMNAMIDYVKKLWEEMDTDDG
ncbi:hypothetical protein BFW01_g9462 [Lasiodiplodia theobromae]|nr:hypothetical protein BFW01_g9462 [Lasiodiplodia theobromae]